MRSRARALLLGAVGIACGACSILSPLAGDDDYSSGDPRPPEGDAGSDGPPSSPEAATSGSCDATFCDDFDEGPLGAQWSERLTSNGELALVPSAVSRPNALRIDLFATTGVERFARLTKHFPWPKSVRCAFQLFLESSPPDDVEVLAFEGKNPGWSYRVSVKLRATDSILREELSAEPSDDPPTQETVTASSVKTGSWVPIALEVEMGKTAKISIGDQAVSMVVRGFSAETMTVSLGESEDRDNEAFSMLVDDFSCTLTP